MWRLLQLDTILADAELNRRAQPLTEVMTLNRFAIECCQERSPKVVCPALHARRASSGEVVERTTSARRRGPAGSLASTSSGVRADGPEASTSGRPSKTPRRSTAGRGGGGIVERYGMEPLIEFYEVFAVTDNARGTVELFEEPALR